MNIFIHLILITTLSLSANAWAHESEKKGDDDSVTKLLSPENANELVGLLVIGRDIEWLQKGNQPPETTAEFSKPPEAVNGDRLYVLAFLTNPGVDTNGITNVICDMTMTRPDGSRAVNEVGVPCLQVPLESDPTHLYQVSGGLGFLAEPSDLRGEWRAEVTLHDRARGTRHPLMGSFIVK